MKDGKGITFQQREYESKDNRGILESEKERGNGHRRIVKDLELQCVSRAKNKDE